MLFHLLNPEHITIRLRFPEGPMAVYPQDHSKEGAEEVPISFTSASPALSTLPGYTVGA